MYDARRELEVERWNERIQLRKEKEENHITIV